MAHLDYLVGEHKHLEMVVEWVKIKLVEDVVFMVFVIVIVIVVVVTGFHKLWEFL